MFTDHDDVSDADSVSIQVPSTLPIIGTSHQ